MPSAGDVAKQSAASMLTSRLPFGGFGKKKKQDEKQAKKQSAKDAAIERQHQARLRFSPSRCAIFPSLRSLTVAGLNSVAGSRTASLGRKRSSQVEKSLAPSTRCMHSASISADNSSG